ncbi:PEPxxWA-CTERM sorting domain-containing protein [uncultured Sphingomonas sp.]|uniref:PEPxxWA-CTERM sorting domain-containing protein n=1 Tax=uncultured Sphingomonas sp. TaxID=158754 RepID=UPI0035C98149
MKKLLALLTTAAAVTMAVAPAQATVIVPGSMGLIFDPFIPATQGSQIAFTSVPGTARTFAATLRSAVYRNTLGTLDFYYQVARTGPGSLADQQIDILTASNFAGFSVDGFVSAADPDGGGAFTAVNNPGTSTTTVGRSPDGQVLQTFFSPNGLIGTENSATYIFRTNATLFTTGTFGLINGSTFDGLAFAPTVPEPATWGMMILGFGLVGGVLRRRKEVVAYA